MVCLTVSYTYLVTTDVSRNRKELMSCQLLSGITTASRLGHSRPCFFFVLCTESRPLKQIARQTVRYSCCILHRFRRRGWMAELSWEGKKLLRGKNGSSRLYMVLASASAYQLRLPSTLQNARRNDFYNILYSSFLPPSLPPSLGEKSRGRPRRPTSATHAHVRK